MPEPPAYVPYYHRNGRAACGDFAFQLEADVRFGTPRRLLDFRRANGDPTNHADLACESCGADLSHADIEAPAGRADVPV